ncbi:MAG TPA: UDP-2,3-diacylglucosamine diphosphatase LpxI [Candidatus Limnocylindrales bacterium]|nr:UDP-2,3-diacylglucosamine diphosphatase LpxI [Candidatus Limnocylindrales bacterium]
MERRLGLMAGAGVLPARAAAEARRQGWGVVAFAFDEAPGLEAVALATIPSRLTELEPVLAELARQRVEATVFVGKMAKQSFLAGAGEADEAGRRLGSGGLSDAALGGMVVATLGVMNIEVLDQRQFLAPWLLTETLLAAGRFSPRAPTEAEWGEIRAGLVLARQMADHGVGQTVVRAHGVTVAVEAAEGTDETIRRGARLAGPGAVVVKAVAARHDYRFDIPTIGAATLTAMAEGGASALAVERGKVLLLDGDEVRQVAADHGIAIVGVDDGRPRDDVAPR